VVCVCVCVCVLLFNVRAPLVIHGGRGHIGGHQVRVAAQDGRRDDRRFN
jgi:hypothetical protein